MFEWSVTEIWSQFIMPWAPSVLQALLILIGGRIAVVIVVRISDTLIRRTPLDNILIRFATSILKTLLMVMVIIAALNPLGVDTTSLIALIGAAGLAVGLAMQDSLKSLAAGVMLIVTQPFKEGDFVDIAGTTGVVETINILNTEMRSGDNKLIIVPNAQIFGATITNFSNRPTRRVDMTFGIGYDSDLKQAKEILQALLAADERVLPEPKAAIMVGALNDNSVDLLCRPWVNTADYWGLYWDMQERVKLAFDEAGINIPFPQMEVHLKKSDAS